MPPEALSSKAGYNFSFDVWSLGCCLYEIVAGDPPFGNSNNSYENVKKEVTYNDVKMKDYFSKDFCSLI